MRIIYLLACLPEVYPIMGTPLNTLPMVFQTFMYKTINIHTDSVLSNALSALWSSHIGLIGKSWGLSSPLIISSVLVLAMVSLFSSHTVQINFVTS